MQRVDDYQIQLTTYASCRHVQAPEVELPMPSLCLHRERPDTCGMFPRCRWSQPTLSRKRCHADRDALAQTDTLGTDYGSPPDAQSSGPASLLDESFHLGRDLPNRRR